MNELAQATKRGPGRPPKYHERAIAAPVEMASPAVEAPAQSAADVGAVPRVKRKPFGALEQKLFYPAREGFHRHWFNDHPGRIARAQEAGYEHVKDNDGKVVTRIVGTAEGGGPLSAYLMEIPEEWWQADMAEQQKQVNEKEETMRRGALEQQAGDNRYVPQQGIKISHGR